MHDRRRSPRNRTFLGGKIVFNSGRSALDCTVRSLSAHGASLAVQSPLGIPDHFFLMIAGQEDLRSCRVVWRAQDKLGITFDADVAQPPEMAAPDGVGLDPSAMRQVLDQIQIGIVLLDSELRAQFINRAFRAMFRLPDGKAKSRPPFVALMYHGRDTRAYELPPRELDRYVAERVALVKAGDPTPIDIRLADGNVLRLHCAVLPGGGRMLSYTPVADIVRNSDELEFLRSALDRVREGIALLDADLHARFLNRAVRELWQIGAEQAGRCPHISELVTDALRTGVYGVPPADLPGFVERRIADIQAGDTTPTDLRTADGRIIRAQCDLLPAGGRMLTYCDVTDLVQAAEAMETLATFDALTGLFNRRHFLALAEAEWARAQRYRRPLSMLVIDVDRFKTINDQFGHEVGDLALREVAGVLQAVRRSSDVVARFGGDEFMVLLPETDAAQAAAAAERLCMAVAVKTLHAGAHPVTLSLSIGVAEARPDMSGLTALIKSADQALFEAKVNGRNRAAVAA